MLTHWCSRQIRPPIYSMKQSKLRRRRVIRFAILYFIMLALFVGLIVGPIVAKDKIPPSLTNLVPMNLLQPLDKIIDRHVIHVDPALLPEQVLQRRDLVLDRPRHDALALLLAQQVLLDAAQHHAQVPVAETVSEEELTVSSKSRFATALRKMA